MSTGSLAIPQATAFYVACCKNVQSTRGKLSLDGQKQSASQTEDSKIVLNSFDCWATEILRLTWIGIAEKNEKDFPSLDKILKQEHNEKDIAPLKELPHTSRASLLRTFLLLILTTTKRYDARTRVLLRQLALTMALPFPGDYEQSVEETIKHPEKYREALQLATSKREQSGRTARNWKIGIAAVAGGVAIGLTGGLAAPLVGAGIGSLLGAVGLGSTAGAILLGTLGSSTLIVGSIFGAYGGHMSGKILANRTKRVSDFEVVPISVDQRLHLTIGISGWLNDKDEVSAPWSVIDGVGDVQALQWEVQSLLELGKALTAMITAQAVGYIKSEILKRTVLATLMSALWPLSLLQVGKLIDNPWANANELAKKTGEVLADVLINKAHGERPVTLVGYSLGARVIFYCLLELSRQNACGIVEHAYMFGLPGPGSKEYWIPIRRIVAGRIVNGYSSKDWLLGFLYRTTNIKYNVPGLAPVNVDGVEDIDVSSLVEGHLKYRGVIGRCLALAKAEDLSEQQINKQDEVLHIIEQQEALGKHESMEELVQEQLNISQAEAESSAGKEAASGSNPLSPPTADATGAAPPLPFRK
ncbi:DUF726-domain-containing protein [Phlyctochytrium arcticum]|nr:DUF726-domain-containing protein [Phlyctochytrium arcticum]